jgi:hypothetical protein
MLDRCPRCGSEWQLTRALSGAPSEFWRECSNPKCNTYLNTYVPQPHQFAFHKDSHRFSGNFGGYGSGKTLTSIEESMKHFFITPNGNTLVGANVQSQYEQTYKRDLEKDIPAAFVKRINTQKSYVDLINGHRIIYRPFDDPEKIRSYNLTQFVIIEASEVKSATFTQLKTRLRNTAGATFKTDPDTGEIIYVTAPTGARIPVIDHDWRKGIIESNPDAGWIRDQVLLVSDVIEKHGKIFDNYKVNEAERDRFISTHVTSTSANAYLPADFIAMNSKNKPAWWVQRYIYGSFLYAEGAVYPKASECVVEPFDIPKSWKRLIAFDYGLADDAVFVFAAIDELKSVVYIYKEVRVNNRSVEELARIYHKETEDIPSGGLVTAPIIDPKSGPKRDYEKRSLSDHFLDYGIAFKPGYVNVDARIFRLNTYFESGKLKIFNTCGALNKELRDYKFKADESQHSGYTGKPEDKNNHGINALEWIAMELPADPKNLVYGIYDRMGRDLTKEKAEQDYGYWALRDDEDSQGYKGDHENVYDIVDYEYNYF